MTRLLKQSTAVTRTMGPFYDSTDGVTLETALTITATDVKVIKNGGASANKNSASAESHLANGLYTLTLDATDTGTLGELIVHVNESGALLNVEYFQVVPANAYDAIYGADDDLVDANGRVNVGLWLDAAVTLSSNNNPDVNINEISDSANAPGVLEDTMLGPLVGTFTGTPSTTSMATATAAFSSSDDWYNGRLLTILNGSAAGQQTDITDYTGSSKTFTVTAVATAPASGDKFIIT